MKTGLSVTIWMTQVRLSSPWPSMLVLPQLLPFRGHKQVLNPWGQERSPNTLHSDSSISSMPWPSSTPLSESWPLESHTGHLQPERQLALKDKICVQSTRASKLWGGEAVVQQYPGQAATDSAQSYERHLCVTSSVSKWHPYPREGQTSSVWWTR